MFKPVKAMEDVQYTETAPVAVDEQMAGRGDEPIIAEAPLSTNIAQNPVGIEVSPDMVPSDGNVEVVIETLHERKKEEPIFPDHYYDDGHIPVFKPVTLRFRPFN